MMDTEDDELMTVYGAEITDQMVDVYQALMQTLTVTNMNNAEISTILMWAAGYMIAERTASGCAFSKDLKELKSLMDEYDFALEDCATKAIISMRDDSTSATFH